MEVDKDKLSKIESFMNSYYQMRDHFDIDTIIKFANTKPDGTNNLEKNIINSLIESKLIYSEFINFLGKLNMEHKLFNNNEMNLYKKIEHYIYKESTRFDRIRDAARLEFENKKSNLKITNQNKKYIYDNQIEAAVEVMDNLFNDDIKAVSLVALPQVGKTGTFIYCTYLAMTHPDNQKIFEPENIFIISGLNDLEWEKQTKNDMFDSLKNNVYHLGQLSKFNEKVNSINNKKILIIIDECQVATSENQSIDKIISKLEENTNNNNNEIKYLVVSATLSVIKYELDEWGHRHQVVFLKSPSSYIGFTNFINEDRIYDAEEMTEDFLEKQFKPLLKNRYLQPKYHILRISVNKRKNFTDWITENHELLKLKKEPIYIDANEKNIHENNNFDIYNVLENIIPDKHTFVIIKQYWRAGKRMCDKNIGIVYEYSKDVNYDITAQGLIGRFCGNDKQENNPTAPIFFCRKETLQGYMNFYKEGCDYTLADYISAKLKIKDNELDRIKKSFVSSILEDKNSPHQFTKREEYVDPPRELLITPAEFDKIKNGKGTQSSSLLDIIQNKYKDLYEIIKDYKCDKCTCPNKALGKNHYSYKRHILDARQNFYDKKPYLADITVETKEESKNAWTAFIDWELNTTHKKHTVYLNVYHGQKKLKLSEERKKLSKEKKNKVDKKIVILEKKTNIASAC